MGNRQRPDHLVRRRHRRSARVVSVHQRRHRRGHEPRHHRGLQRLVRGGRQLRRQGRHRHRAERTGLDDHRGDQHGGHVRRRRRARRAADRVHHQQRRGLRHLRQRGLVADGHRDHHRRAHRLPHLPDLSRRSVLRIGDRLEQRVIPRGLRLQLVPDLQRIDVCGAGLLVDPAINPGATPDVCDGVDSDCNGFDCPAITDQDEDGFAEDVDCDDDDATVFPGATETCEDGIDQDCDGVDQECDGDLDG
ncbi:MAG: hypothetical protein GY898_01865 [Proteobacteria bacterium]|nr:hypothetical protein [Pseudomonadota bacterium]